MLREKTLIVAATTAECEGFLPPSPPTITLGESVSISENTDLMVTGIGVASSAFCLGRVNLQHYDRIVGIGFAGSYSRALRIGDIAIVSRDRFADYGLWAGSRLEPLSQRGFPPLYPEDADGFIRVTNAEVAKLPYPAVRGNTVSHPSEGRGIVGISREECAGMVETMEGACLGLVANTKGVETLSLRVISNYCAERDLAEWDVELATRRLGEAVEELFL